MYKEPTDVKSIFWNAIENGGMKERAAYLDEACKNDPELRSKIEDLLKLHDNAGSFLESPIIGPEVTLNDSPLSEAPGTIVGRYKLLEKVGEGGMAVVYMAEQKRPIRRRVAVKLIKLGMDTKSVIARFEAERQALAMMDHPNIARVLDAGATETGRPYFVMELVRGVSITDFCDKNKLSTRQRLELFIPICQAVHHAHQKGIIHRDIKPSNVMVTLHDGQPVVKVIDFGIAKAVNQELTEKTVFTQYAQMIGTPEYMSPEQAEMSGLGIDVRTDVFSLGVLLYELLTGTTPFDAEYLRSKGYAEIQRIIREEEPLRPSTKISTLGEALVDIAKSRQTSPEMLAKRIREELDWIAMKTLEKDRNRRYESVSELAADVKRHLNQEPVLAGPPSRIYVARKFVQRHSVVVSAVTVVLAGMLAALIFSTWMYVRAERALRRESAARSETKVVSDFLTDDLLGSVHPEQARSPEVTVQYLLQKASENLNSRFENSPMSEAIVRETLGRTYKDLCDYNEAETHLFRVLEIRRQHLGEDDPTTLRSLSHLGEIYSLQGRYNEAEILLKKALAARIRVLGEKHPDTLESMCILGWEYAYQKVGKRFEKSGELFANALEVGRRELGEDNVIVLNAMHGLAFQHTLAYRFDEAESLSQKGLDISNRLLGKEHVQTLMFMNMIAWVWGQRRPQESHKAALELVIEALEISQRVLGEKHLCTVLLLNNLGWLYTKLDRHDEALQPLVRSVELCHQVINEAHPTSQYLMYRLQTLYRNREQYTEADDLLCKIVEISQRVHGLDYPHTTIYRGKLIRRAEELGSLGLQQYDAHSYHDALTTFRKLTNIDRVLYGKTGASHQAYMAMSLHQLGRRSEAKNCLDQVRQEYQQRERAPDEMHLCKAEQLFAGENSEASNAWAAIEVGDLEQAQKTLQRLRTLPRENSYANGGGINSISTALAQSYCRAAIEARHSDEGVSRRMAFYEAALRADPNCIPALRDLAWLLAVCPEADLRDGTKALALARRACELSDSQECGCLASLAAAHAENGDFPTAVKLQREAIKHLSQGRSPHELETRLKLYESAKHVHAEHVRPLVAWWKCEETDDQQVQDSSGSALHGELVGDARIVLDPDRGHVLSLDGQKDWVDCGSDIRFNLCGEATISAWIRVTASNRRYQVVVDKGDTAWRLQRDSQADTMNLCCAGLEVPGDPWGTLRGTRNVNDDNWHHVVGVYDGTTMYLYIDGGLGSSIRAVGTVDVNSQPLYIGANSGYSGGREWNGLIDDVRIYNYALTEAEIMALYAGKESEERGR